MNKDTNFRMPAAASGGGWEMRPGGMLVQKRNSDMNSNPNLVPNIRIKVKFRSSYHEVTINSQATFGQLKKVMARMTGVDANDQRMTYKEKERGSKDFLDLCGVKDGSKIVMVEDELSRERRVVESRKDARMDKASKDIAAVSCTVDNLAKQVAAAESEVRKGRKVADMDLLNLIELLMRELIKLDGIDADGDVKLQRRMQVKRVQKYIETLDGLKLGNSGEGKGLSKQGSSKTGEVMVTTKWETF